MNEQRFPIFEVIAATSTLCIAIVALWKLEPDLKSEVAAGWAQAIGAIVAIAVAFFIGERQAHAARLAAIELQERDRKNKLASILAICKAAYDRSLAIGKVFGGEYNSAQRFNIYDHSLIHGAISALQSISVVDIGNTEAILAFLTMKDQLSFVMRAIDDFDKHLPGGTREDHLNNREVKKVKQGNIMLHASNISACFHTIEKTIGAPS